MIRRRVLLTDALILTSLFFFRMVEAADLVIVRDGKAKAVIVLSEDPSSAARKAAIIQA
jgi:hypothetical protein